MVSAAAEAGLAVGTSLARGLGVPSRAVAGLADVLRVELDNRSIQMAHELGSGGPSQSGAEADGTTAVSVFKFDQAKAPAFSDDPISPDSVPELAGSVDGLGSGLLSSLISTLESVGGTTSSSEDEAAAAPAALGSGAFGSTLDDAVIEADVVSILESTDLEGGDVDIVLPPECVTAPDGSEQCPVAWGAMSSGDEAEDAQAGAAGAGGAAAAATAAQPRP